MTRQSTSYLWREPEAAKGFRAGVSLHSHTNQSVETLNFVSEFSNDWKFLQPIMRWAENRSVRHSGIIPNYARGYWTPPLTPRLAFDLECGQIEKSLDLPSFVSLSDHDNISAPLLLRSVKPDCDIPISVEWTVPFGKTSFHLGIHNLPAATARDWMERMLAFTALPEESRPTRLLSEMLSTLHAISDVLVIFNHPLWDLYRIGRDAHIVHVHDFLATHGQFIHALELNGLRNWKENREVSELAGKWNQIVISGGDRHGIEPNANINLSRADTFAGFVHEVRRERQSHVLFMPQYAEPWKHRILQSTLDAIRDHPDFPIGSQRWDERVFHPNAAGQMRPLTDLWTTGRPPKYIRYILACVRMMGAPPVSGGLRLAWNDSGEMQATLAKLDA